MVMCGDLALRPGRLQLQSGHGKTTALRKTVGQRMDGVPNCSVQI